jgi:hypothetical protein
MNMKSCTWIHQLCIDDQNSRTAIADEEEEEEVPADEVPLEVDDEAAAVSYGDS